MTSYMVKILSALFLVVGIMVAVAYMFRKATLRVGGGEGGELISVVATKYLGPKSAILLVEVCGDVFVIGQSQQQISLLAKLEGAARESLAERRRRVAGGSFSEHLASCKTKLFPFNRGEKKD